MGDKREGKKGTRNEQNTRNGMTTNIQSRSLTLTLSAADLSTETGLDGRDRTTGTTRVASDEVQTVFTLVKLGVGTAAGLAGNVFD